MYNQKLVTCIKSNGKVLREFKDTVYIPFGSEFSIYLKNLNSVRAEVSITIDGQDVCDSKLVVNANSELDIERFVKDNLKKGNRFKFIERTGRIEDYRGIKAEDGLIRVAFKFEKIYPLYRHPLLGCRPGHWEWKPNSPSWFSPYLGTNAIGTAQCNINTSTTIASSGDASYSKCATTTLRGVTQDGGQSVETKSAFVNQVANDVGITVPGSESNQQFQTVSSFATEDEEHVMILRLLGETESGKEVMQPVTVKVKPKCVTCGRNNKATAKFCVECGTALSIL